MKTVLILATITTLLLGSVFLFTQESSTTEFVEAYEDRQTLSSGGIVTWDLKSQSLDDQLLISIAKSIQRGKVQQNVGTQYIYGLVIDISSNPSINNITELLSSINSGLPLLTSLEIRASSNSLKFDSAFANYSIPSKITSFKFICQGHTENSISNLTKVINNKSGLKELELDFFNGYFKNLDELVATVAQKTTLTSFKINAGSNYQSVGNANFKSDLTNILSKNRSLKYVYLGLYNTGVQKSQLNSIEDALYDLSYLKTFILDTRSNNLKKADVEEIFQDVAKKVEFTLYN